MRAILALYKNAFGGLSAKVWMLALVILINRAGSMVMPFLSVYLTQSLGFSLIQAGWLMGAYGMGAIFGALIGGWLTDKMGHFRVQFISLMGGGLMFICLSYFESYYPLLLFILITSMVTEMLRPANQSSIAHYSKAGNVTRAFSLNRMAINLGFSVGPAIGGLLAAVSYKWLFIADGITCMVAGVVFFLYFRNIRIQNPSKAPSSGATSISTRVWTDGKFIVFIALVIGFGAIFFQLFTTWPVYQREVFHLSERQIGYLLGLNGFIVFLFEMVLIYKLGEKVSIRRMLFIGSILVSLAFLSLFAFHEVWALYAACIFISYGEIMAMPFMATFTTRRSNEINRGSYMGLYSMAFAASFVLAPLVGTNIISAFGFSYWWLTAAIFMVLVGFSFLWLLKKGTG